MSRPSDRRGFLRGLAVLPLVGGGIALTAAGGRAEPSGVTPELARLIAKHDRVNTILNADDLFEPGPVRAAARMRTRVAMYPSAGLPDLLAKAAVLARLYPLEDLRAELSETAAAGHFYLDDMALALAAEIMGIAEHSRRIGGEGGHV